MLKKIGTAVVVALVVIGTLNVYSLNKPVFKSVKHTVTTKAVGDIPGETFAEVTKHHWRFTGK